MGFESTKKINPDETAVIDMEAPASGAEVAVAEDSRLEPFEMNQEVLDMIKDLPQDFEFLENHRPEQNAIYLGNKKDRVRDTYEFAQKLSKLIADVTKDIEELAKHNKFSDSDQSRIIGFWQSFWGKDTEQLLKEEGDSDPEKFESYIRMIQKFKMELFENYPFIQEVPEDHVIEDFVFNHEEPEGVQVLRRFYGDGVKVSRNGRVRIDNAALEFDTSILEGPHETYEYPLPTVRDGALSVELQTFETFPDKRYEKMTRLGAGGMGEVSLYVDRFLQHPVAIKRIPKTDQLEDVNFYHDESQFLRELNEAVLYSRSGQVHEVYIDIVNGHKQLVIVEDYIAGYSLEDSIATEGDFEWTNEAAIDMCVKASEEVAKMHDNGVINGDIKPDNIMVTSGGNARIIDMGIGRKTGGSHDVGLAAMTSLQEALALPRERYGGPAIGTLPYIPPELLLPHIGVERVAPRVDVYAMGMVLLDLLHKGNPYSFMEKNAIMFNKVSEKFGGLDIDGINIPKPLKKIIKKAIGFDHKLFGKPSAPGFGELRELKERKEALIADAEALYARDYAKFSKKLKKDLAKLYKSDSTHYQDTASATQSLIDVYDGLLKKDRFSEQDKKKITQIFQAYEDLELADNRDDVIRANLKRIRDEKELELARIVVDASLSAETTRLLEKATKNRYQSMEEMIEDLREAKQLLREETEEARLAAKARRLASIDKLKGAIAKRKAEKKAARRKSS